MGWIESSSFAQAAAAAAAAAVGQPVRLLFFSIDDLAARVCCAFDFFFIESTPCF
jgi:hypothetical protein